MNIEFLLLTYNRLGVVSRCFKSLAPTLAQGVKWSVMDNGSSDSTPLWLTKLANRYDNINITLSAINHGVAGGREMLLRQATGDVLAFLDSDIEAITPDWLDKFVKPLENPAIGMCGAAGSFINPDWTLNLQDAGYTGEVDVLSGFCQFFRRADLADYHFDMAFNGNGAEDDDTCLWLKSRGLQIHQIGNAGIKHTYSGTWVTSNDGYDKARAYLRQKWQGRGVLLHERGKVA